MSFFFFHSSLHVWRENIHICRYLSTHAHKYESSVSHKMKKELGEQGPQPHNKYIQCVAILRTTVLSLHKLSSVTSEAGVSSDLC